MQFKLSYNKVKVSYLFNVSSSDELGAEKEALSLGLLQVGGDLVERLPQVALIRVENDRLVTVVLTHELERDARDGRLEVRLLGVDHYTDVHISGSLTTRKN